MLMTGTLLAVALAGPSTGPDSVVVTVDSARHEIIVTAGPFHISALAAMDHHAMGSGRSADTGANAGAARDTPIGHFAWPVKGWLRGFQLRVTDAQGDTLGGHLVHHFIVVNFSRRQLLYPAPERLLGAGSETGDVTVPKTVGIPMSPAMQIGMYAGWHNETGRDLHDVYVTLTLHWTPKNQMPQPVSVLPVYMDVNLTVGGSNTFDIPPGRSAKAHEFTMPVGGRLLGVGGHLHDYGLGVRLEDVGAGKIVTEIAATRNADGTITGVGRRLFGVAGRGLKLRQWRRYRVVGVYDNPTGKHLARGAMAHMVGIFAPDRLAEWPDIDPADPEYQRDLTALQVERQPDGTIVPAPQ